jgi:hypothetical protein
MKETDRGAVLIVTCDTDADYLYIQVAMRSLKQTSVFHCQPQMSFNTTTICFCPTPPLATTRTFYFENIKQSQISILWGWGTCQSAVQLVCIGVGERLTRAGVAETHDLRAPRRNETRQERLLKVFMIRVFVKQLMFDHQ